MDNCILEPGRSLSDVAALLREQLRACHESAKSCFARASEPDVYYESRDTALAMGTRLIHATSSLAIALKRIEGAPQQTLMSRARAE